MALRDKLAERSYAFLEPGEQVHHVLQAQTGPNPLLGGLTWLVWFWVKTYVVVVTDRAVVLLPSSMWTPAKPRGVYKRLPRQTLLGPVSGLWAQTTLDGERFWINKRFHKDVLAADTQLGQLGAGQPQQWPQQPGQAQQQWPQQPGQPGAQLG